MPRRARLSVEALQWPDFREWFGDVWHPGDHVSVIAPTGAGKSTFVGNLLDLRRYVLALDPKGGDETLGNLGWPRLPDWPGEREMLRRIDRNEHDNRPSRYVVGPVTHSRKDLDRLVKACAETLDAAFDMGHFTVYVDELQVLCDRRLMNLGAKAVRLLISARSKAVTFVSSFQAPSWVVPEAIRQPTWVAVSYTRDIDVVNRLAEVLGRPKDEIRGFISELGRFTWGVIGRDPHEPFRITRPPILTKRAA